MRMHINRVLYRAFAIGLLLVPAALVWRAAEGRQAESDPHRFLKVQDWTLTATFTAEQVRDEAGLYQTHSVVRHSFTARAHLTEKQGAAGLGQRWHAVPSAQGGVHDTCSLKGGEDSHLLTTAGDGETTRGRAEFSLDLTSGEYWVNVSFGRMGLHNEQKAWTKDGQTADYAFDVEGEAPGFRVAGQKLPQTGLVIEGSTVLPDYQFNYSGSACALLKVDAQVSWRIAPGDEEESELEVTVEGGDDGYEEWLPKGNLDPASPGAKMGVTAELRSAKGGSTKLKAKQFKFELIDTSQEPGVAINFPVQNPDTGFDLRFNPDFDPFKADGPHPLFENKEQTLTYDIEKDPGKKAPPMTQASAEINCYDWGAWSMLKVTAVLETGKTVTGYLKGHKDQKTIRLPKRAENSKIADKWKSDCGVAGLSDASDEENTPPGDGNRGDGLTLYEEYRGIYEGGDHVRLVDSDSRDKKDFFIFNTKEVAKAAKGIELFENASMLKVHSNFTDMEWAKDRVINRNYSAASAQENRHRVDQHGVVLKTWNRDESRAGDADTKPGTPKSVPIIYLSAGHLDAGGGEVEAEVAHELMHACNVWHHGDGDIGNVIWKKKLDKDQIYEVKDGTETPITVYENGRRVSASELTGGSIKIWLGVEHGQHSGVETCLMRYHVKVAARKDTRTENVRYLTVGGAIGRALCNDPKGTGINAAGKEWGDTAEGRGACAKQICINDAVAAPKR